MGKNYNYVLYLLSFIYFRIIVIKCYFLSSSRSQTPCDEVTAFQTSRSAVVFIREYDNSSLNPSKRQSHQSFSHIMAPKLRPLRVHFDLPLIFKL